MGASSSSSVQAARKAIADRLHGLRLDAGLTAHRLSETCGWHPAKTSRIEHAKAAPSDADIRAWCRACGADDQVADLIAASRDADSMYIEWKRLQRGGLRQLQESRVPLYERTRLFRTYSSHVMPGLLQTPEYATALMAAITDFRGTPNDVAEAVEARMARSDVIRQGRARFAMLIEESVLRYQIGSPEVMAGQLGALLSAMALPAVSLGIVPFSARSRAQWVTEAFTMFDDSRVHVELLAAQVTVTAPGEVDLYVRAHARLMDMAVRGEHARRLVAAALSALAG
ncbi:helix-turn-helix domain-containing protein [Streptomyces sp. 3MP-14]|uniref:Helix-turn-helix domain-containing protein n=1 Tax=Streptomyces mimosae TaxID=2586635 RepID=A0A5N6A4K3_9ACTN|nr:MULTISPECIES: helix-turn-helix transcriptional regulator [Streptomyces]KAB8162909.1 helix-turn-helix domain-containing protein [Streptomyces mimosae]KAB8179122.1 helix-turn-helix domain-containing protein [Streptomyces sp. 3MP-14]